MDRNLKDKIVAITGGAEGIGYEIADNYLQKGAKLAIILDINLKLGADAVKTLTAKHGANKAVFYKCDVITDLEDVSQKIIANHSKIDILFNNAGILDEKLIRKTIEINVTGVVEWSLKFWEHMNKKEGGSGGTIINLASIYGFRVDQYLPVYQASKFAVQGFTKSLGHEYNYNRSGVRVLAINPGFTDTKLVANPIVSNDKQVQSDFDIFLKNQKWQKVDSVAKAAVEVFEKANSGTCWLIEGAKPIVQV